MPTAVFFMSVLIKVLKEVSSHRDEDGWRYVRVDVGYGFYIYDVVEGVGVFGDRLRALRMVDVMEKVNG